MNPTPSNLGDIKLTYRFILGGLLSFIIYVLLFFRGLYHLSEGIYRVNDIWALVHTFILGFLMMVVMGVMYQLIPVALLVPIYSYRLSKIQFWTYIIGVFGLIIGLWMVDTNLMALFGTFAFTGVLLFVLNMFLSVRKIAKWSMMSIIIVTAIFYLFMTVLFGLLLVLNYRFSWWPNIHDHLLYSHIIFGLVGWLSSVIMGFTYKMAPMFSLAHGYSEKYAKWIYSSVQIGIIFLVLGIFEVKTVYVGLGAVFLFIGFVLFGLQVHQIMKHKMKTHLDIGFKIAILSVYGTLMLLILSPLLFLVFKNGFLLPFAYLFIAGWLGFSILGYLFKIVPFLYWTEKYSERVGKEQVPMLRDMVDEKKGKIAFLLLVIGLIGNAIGIGLKVPFLIYMTNTVFALGVLLYSYLILKVFRT